MLVESNCLQMEFAVRAEGSDERKRGANYLSSLGYRGLSFLSVPEMQAWKHIGISAQMHITVMSQVISDGLILKRTVTYLHALRQHSWRKGQRLQKYQNTSKLKL